MEKQASSRGGVSLKIVHYDIRITMRVTHAEAIILEQIRKLTKKDIGAISRYAGYLKNQTEKEKKVRKTKLKQVA